MSGMYSFLSFGRKSPFRNKTMAVVNFYEIEGNGDEVVVCSGKYSISQALKTFIQGGILKLESGGETSEGRL